LSNSLYIFVTANQSLSVVLCFFLYQSGMSPSMSYGPAT
jgi:hypothetical protein